MLDVVLVSESELRARKRVAAILDRYARRVGADTWVTPITQEGLQVLEKTLRKAATRQMAVTCFRRMPEGLTPVWSIGRSVHAQNDGSIPVHRHALPKPVLPPQWRKACLLAQAAGLAHDLGKASCDFQAKLRNSAGKPMGDPVRHEWLSVHLLQTMFRIMEANPGQQPPSWAHLWQEMQQKAGKTAIQTLIRSVSGTVLGSYREARPKKGLIPSPASTEGEGGIVDAKTALLWLVATHHRFPRLSKPLTNSEAVPENKNTGIDPLDRSFSATASLETYFKNGQLPISPIAFSHHATTQLEGILKALWRAIDRLVDFDQKFLSQPRDPQTTTPLTPKARQDFWHAMAHAVRPSLILADHEVSSVHLQAGQATANGLAANTWRPTQSLNQPLNWHLENVGKTASMMVRETYQFAPRGVPESLRKQLCEDVPSDHPFYWQTRIGVRLRQSLRRPTLVLNMAGTGTGKTRMNARILAELRDEDTPLRFATALNLRTLTLQTIDSYREELGLGDHMAGVIGDKVAQNLHIHAKNSLDPLDAEADEDGNPIPTHWDTLSPKSLSSQEVPQWLADALTKQNHKGLAPILLAPVAVCTADFLVDAGDLSRQGNQALAQLRLAKSDLVLDEIDSYDTQPLIALLRMVSMAAFFDRNVVASSATLSVPCAQALVKAWQHGRWLRHCLDGDTAAPSQVFICDHETDLTSWDPILPADNFKAVYQNHVKLMLEKLRQRPAKRHIEMVPTYKATNKGYEFSQEAWMEAVRLGCSRFHQAHRQTIEGRQVSIGLVRVANIKQAIALADHLAQEATSDGQTHWQVACYHSNLPVIGRHWIEKHLDIVLKRRPKGKAVDALPSNKVFLEMLAKCPAGKDTLFVVVATPVEEIGRDHDFDWALIEPSSTQSIVQTAGRVRRHRDAGSLDSNGSHAPNIGLLELPWRYLGQRFDAFRKEPWPKPGTKMPPLFLRPGLDTEVNEYRENQNLPRGETGTFLSRLLAKQPVPDHQPIPFGALSRLLDLEHLKQVGLDAGLKFDLLPNGKPRHLFSEFDNASQTAQLDTALRFFSVSHQDRVSWSLHDAYRFYSLRPFDPARVEVNVQLPDGPTLEDLSQHSTTQVKASTLVGNHNGVNTQIRNLKLEPLADHAWLGLPVDTPLGELCKQLGLTSEQGLTVKHSVFLDGKDDPTALKKERWHLSFGMGRPPQ